MLDRRISTFSRNPQFPVALNENAATCAEVFSLRPTVRDAQSVLLETNDDMRFVDSVMMKYALAGGSNSRKTTSTGMDSKRSSFLFEEDSTGPSESHSSSKGSSRAMSASNGASEWVQLPVAAVGIQSNHNSSTSRKKMSLPPLKMSVISEKENTSPKAPVTPRYPESAWSPTTRKGSVFKTDEAEDSTREEALPLSKFLEKALQFQRTRLIELQAIWRTADCLQDCWTEYAHILSEEEECRNRLVLLFVEVTEKVYRDMVYHEYEKFVVFCIDKEPVWRKAARQLQIKNEERLNSTENIYERFQLQELAVREKQKIFVEAMDYVFSLKIVEHDAMKEAINTARNRRRETMQAAPPAPVIVSREVGGRPPEPAKRVPEIPKEDKNKRGNPAPRPAPKTNHVPRPPTHPRPTSSGSGKSGKSSESGGKPHKDGKGSSGAAKAASHGIVATSSGSSGNSSGAKNKSKEPTTLISNIKRLV